MTAIPPPIALPQDIAFIQTLNAIFRAQAMELISRQAMNALRTGQELDLEHWIPAMVQALRPYTLRSRLVGMRQGDIKVAHAVRARPTVKAYRAMPPMVRKQMGVNWDLINPKVIAAVDSATMLFCRETNDTATLRLNEAIAKLREEMKEGLSEGEGVRLLSNRVRTIFADPKRAFTIASTENSRSTYAGEMQSMRESGVIDRSRWTASAAACPKCLELDGKEVPLGEPFIVLSGGNPAYRIVYHPPLHPCCFCAIVGVLAPVNKPTIFMSPPTPQVVLHPGNLAGTRPLDPWKGLEHKAPVLMDKLAKDKDAQRKAKAIVGFKNPHAKELVRAEFETYNATLESQRLIDEYDATYMNMPHAEAQAAKQRAIESIDRVNKLKTEAAVIKARRDAENQEHLAKVLKAKNPVAIQPTFDARHPLNQRMQDKVKEVCELLESILGQSSHGEHAVKVSFHQVPSYEEQRAYQSNGKVWLTTGSSNSTIAHEIGHALETMFPLAGEALRAFWEARCKNTPSVNMRQEFGIGYGPNEIGNEDEFWKVLGKGENKSAYAGKTYKTGHTEILSIGLETLLDNPHRMAKMDPEWFNLLVGILRGDLR